MFGDLFHHRTAQASLVVAVAGFDAVMVGVLIRSAAVVAVGGLLVSLTGLIVTANLVQGPRRAIRDPPVRRGHVSEVAPPPWSRPARHHDGRASRPPLHPLSCRGDPE
jgi:hypothetical protein